MTGKERHHDHDEERLAQLYREQGDIEPGPGVDQGIRARARDEAQSSSLPRPAKWLGGAAVAASLIVVVAVVTSIEHPEAEHPGGQSTRSDAGKTEAAELETLQADAPEPAAREAAAPASADVASRSPAEDRHGEEAGPLEEDAESKEASPPPDTDTMLQRRTRWDAEDNARRIAGEHFRALGEPRDPEEGGPEADQPVGLTAEVESAEANARAADRKRSLWLMEQLIAIGNAERARAEMADYRERYPDEELPQRTLDQFEQLESSADPD